MKAMTSALTLALLAAPLGAQERPDADQRITELERRLEALSKELEAQKMGTAPVEAKAGAYGLGAAAAKVYAGAGLSIGGYGEFLYLDSAAKDQAGRVDPAGAARNLDALRLILYTGYKFSDRIVFNSELEFEHGGYSDEHVEGEAVVEFAYLDFLFTKAFNLRAGQLLLPLGWINELHEPPAFLGARRPLVERALIPSTWHENGVGIHGELPGNLSYRAYLVNGLNALGAGEGATEGFSAGGIKGGRQAGKNAEARRFAWTGRLDWNPLPGSTLGAGLYTGDSNQSGQGPALRTNLWELHGEYRARGLQLRALYAALTVDRAGVGALAEDLAARQVGTRQWGGYLEAGYDLLGSGRGALIPYLRWERVNTQAEVAAGVAPDPANDRTQLTAGLAWKPIPNVSVKADWTRVGAGDRSGRDQLALSLGYYF